MTDTPPAPHGVAYADESFLEADSGGFYVIAAAVIENHGIEEARQEMLALRGKRRTNKTHWTEMDPGERAHAAKMVATLEGLHIVTVGRPVPPKHQDRARAKCLQPLVAELNGYGVGTLFLEARNAKQDKWDIKTVIATRRALGKINFNVAHLYGGNEPLLWVADIVAGAVQASRRGYPAYRNVLDNQVYEIEIDTGC
ncbi:hypothetical protein F4561_004132 [Lipingzhangella halophila]|uniref:DUF3800 domain-containing protein n=1 Tax=Lipingzhangella halophila TaxID=1783352 RepID=A0A7W7W3R0_9ACTN|nr:hypothetical protein [Lipingzhangella halophila]MBB4933312.1 hypothetical protein [Lipingzhangella halophila]